jgi:hypothetical protein
MTVPLAHAEWIRVQFPGWPLAIYRELATHLRQLGMQTEVLLRTTPDFNYLLDQVESLGFIPPKEGQMRAYTASILQYYLERYWEAPISKGQNPSIVIGTEVIAWKNGFDWLSLF